MGSMKNWPTSKPDYQWPEHFFGSARMAPTRWLMASVFHIAYAIGRLFARATERYYGFTTPPSLVIRTDGIGDALLFEPALESLARIISPSEVHVWAPAGACQLLAECPTITRRMTIPRGGKNGNLNYFTSLFWRAKLGFELGRWTFEKVIYPADSPEPFGNWLFLSARARDRWINAGDTLNQFEWQQNRTHAAATRVLERRPGAAHELQRNEYLSDQWAEEGRLRKPRVHLSIEAAFEADTIATEWRRVVDRMGAEEMVGLVAGGTSAVNQYPPEKWAEVLQKLWDEHRTVAVLLGGRDDVETLDNLAAHLRNVPHLRLIKPVHLLTMAGMIRRLDGMLSVDTGLAHVATAMRVPTVVLVGGGNPGRFFPWPNARDQIALNVSMPCEGCNNNCHLPNANCVTDINPDEIVAAYAQLRRKNIKIDTMVVAAEYPQHRKVAG